MPECNVILEKETKKKQNKTTKQNKTKNKNGKTTNKHGTHKGNKKLSGINFTFVCMYIFTQLYLTCIIAFTHRHISTYIWNTTLHILKNMYIYVYIYMGY